MHLDGLDVSADHDWGEGHVHVGLEHSGLDSSDGHRADTTDLVNVLQGKSQWLVGGSLGGDDVVQSIDQGGALVPAEVGGRLQHVVTVPSGNGDEWDRGRVVTHLLQVDGQLVLDLVVSVLGPVHGLLVHLVAANNHLLHSQSEGQQSVLSGLSVLGNPGLEFSLRGGDHEDGHIGL